MQSDFSKKIPTVTKENLPMAGEMAQQLTEQLAALPEDQSSISGIHSSQLAHSNL